MDIKENKYPTFWKSIQDSKRVKSGSKLFAQDMINKDLKCPMNYLCTLSLPKCHSSEKTLPMDYFFQKFELDEHRRKSKKVEKLIESYSLTLKDYRNEDEDLLLRADYEQLIEDIKKIYISNSYIGLTSWLIDRAFCISKSQKQNSNTINNNTNKNKSLLLKVLYDINPNNVIKCFSKNL